MSEVKKEIWLVIERYGYSSSDATHSVKKTAYSVEEAIKYKLCLEKLNDSKNQSYFLASDVDTMLENVARSHNKSVENGSYYENHPEVEKPEEVKI